MRQITVNISEDLYRNITFLEKSQFVKSKGEAVATALEFYRRLAMHDWLPYMYRMGGGRVVLMDTVMLSDLFHLMTNQAIYNAARASALKRKLTNPYFKDVDFAQTENWPLVLRELEIMGWGKFTKFRNEIRVEFCTFPEPYLLGYFESMFKVEFERHPSRIPEMTVFIAKKRKETVFEE
jgi:hypothetical protein